MALRADPAGADPPSLAHAAARDDLEDHDDDGHDEQHVQQSARGERRDQAEQPKNEQDQRDGVEHGLPPGG